MNVEILPFSMWAVTSGRAVIYFHTVKPAVSLSQLDVLHWECRIPHGALQWVPLENTACQMPILNARVVSSLLVINTGKRIIKLSWFLHHPQKNSFYGLHIKEKELIVIGIICNKQTKKTAISSHKWGNEVERTKWKVSYCLWSHFDQIL